LVLVLWTVAQPAWAIPTTAVVAGELLGGALGGVAGAAIAVTAIREITPTLEPRAARVATVITSVTLGAGLGGSAGVLATGRLLDIEGNVTGCLLGGLAGGLASTFVEPLFYTLGVPEEITEFLGMLFLPLAPAIGAVIGFNVGRQAP
jgi:hypothetical protein